MFGISITREGATLPIKSLSSGGVIATYKCSAACGHCLYGSSPCAEPGYMDPAAAARLCKHIRRLGCTGLHIGGGEPFLDVDGLIGLIQTIIQSGLRIDYIETNASWISGDDQRDRQTIGNVVNAGGDCIMVSADPFHVEFVPFWKPKRLISLLVDMGVSHFIWQERYLPLLSALDPTKKYGAKALEDKLGYDAIHQCAQEYGMRGNGRALNLLRKYGRRKAAGDFSQPCPELRSTNHFHIDPLGRYIPPGCPGLGILAEDLGKDLDPAAYPAVSRLFAGGVSALLQHAQETGYALSQGGYVSKCELCFSIRKYLIARDGRAYPDITPASFYTQDF